MERGPIGNQQVLSVWLYELLTDIYGNVPYSQAGQGTGNLTPAYDDSHTIYDSLIAKLDASVAMMDSSREGFKSGELYYNGNIAQWKKLAESLKLRMGIRMADADPAASKAAVEQAVAAGVMQTGQSGPDLSVRNGDDALFPYEAAAPYQIPYNASLRALTFFLASSTLINFMDTLRDPRLPLYATLRRQALWDQYVLGRF